MTQNKGEEGTQWHKKKQDKQRKPAIRESRDEKNLEEGDKETRSVGSWKKRECGGMKSRQPWYSATLATSSGTGRPGRTSLGPCSYVFLNKLSTVLNLSMFLETKRSTVCENTVALISFITKKAQIHNLCLK